MFQSFLKKFKGDSGAMPQKDPVCGMRATDEITLVYKEQTYAFCSDHCKQQFAKNPESYIAK